ncbi:MAG TPA: translation initiation factor IF-3 [Acholeplasmataceae bacterium]|nr:translation initiation factor IF-3 [Acholeplasmataceae bacterium]
MKLNKRRDAELVNENIPNIELLLIDDEGNNLGKMMRDKALTITYEKDLDLVVVAPDAKMIVAKMMDYSKYRYEQQRKLRDMKKNRNVVDVKEIRLSPVIGDHDLNTKLNHAKRFISKGDKIKVSMRFRGRMITHSDLGKEVMQKFIDELGELVIVESKPKLEGYQLIAVLSPNTNQS